MFGRIINYFRKNKPSKLDSRYWVMFSCDDNDKFYVDVGYVTPVDNHVSQMVAGLINGVLTGKLNGEIMQNLHGLNDDVVNRLLQDLSNQRSFLNPLDI